MLPEVADDFFVDAPPSLWSARGLTHDPSPEIIGESLTFMGVTDSCAAKKCRPFYVGLEIK